MSYWFSAGRGTGRRTWLPVGSAACLLLWPMGQAVAQVDPGDGSPQVLATGPVSEPFAPPPAATTQNGGTWTPVQPCSGSWVPEPAPTAAVATAGGATAAGCVWVPGHFVFEACGNVWRKAWVPGCWAATPGATTWQQPAPAAGSVPACVAAQPCSTSTGTVVAPYYPDTSAYAPAPASYNCQAERRWQDYYAARRAEVLRYWLDRAARVACQRYEQAQAARPRYTPQPAPVYRTQPESYCSPPHRQPRVVAVDYTCRPAPRRYEFHYRPSCSPPPSPALRMPSMSNYWLPRFPTPFRAWGSRRR